MGEAVLSPSFDSPGASSQFFLATVVVTLRETLVEKIGLVMSWLF